MTMTLITLVHQQHRCDTEIDLKYTSVLLHKTWITDKDKSAKKLFKSESKDILT